MYVSLDTTSMALFRVTKNYCYGLQTEIEANSLDEAKQICEEQSGNLDWLKADGDEDFYVDEMWESYNEDYEDYEPVVE